MPQPLMLEGSVDNRDAIIEAQQDEIRDLKRQLAEARAETSQAKRANKQAVAALQHQMLPWYRALQALFGEIENLQIGEDAPAVSGKVSAVWESWKRKLGGKQAEVIDALLEHDEMSVPQLRVATHSGQQTIYDVTSKLFRLGLINKNGGKYSLKAL